MCRRKIKTVYDLWQLGKKRFYSNRIWTEKRNAYLLTHPVCAVCGGAAEQVHHIIPYEECDGRENGGLLDDWNLMPICKECHYRHHRDESVKHCYSQADVMRILCLSGGYRNQYLHRNQFRWYRSGKRGESNRIDPIGFYEFLYKRLFSRKKKDKVDLGALWEITRKKGIHIPESIRAGILIHDLRGIDTQSEQAYIRLQYISGGQRNENW